MHWRNEKGQIAILFVMLMPIFLLLVVMLRDFSRLIELKINLQGALDQAVFSGARTLTSLLNTMAMENWRAYKLFRDLEKDFDFASQDLKEEAKKRVEETDGKQAEHFEKMLQLASKGYEVACDEAKKNLDLDGARFVPLYFVPLYGVGLGYDGASYKCTNPMRMLSFGVADKRKLNWGFGKVNVWDPHGPKVMGSKELYKYMARTDSGLVAFAGAAVSEFESKFLGIRIPIIAVSAAQPHDGSLLMFGKGRGESEEEGIGLGKPWWYKTAFVPFRSLDGEGVRHAREGCTGEICQEVWNVLQSGTVVH